MKEQKPLFIEQNLVDKAIEARRNLIGKIREFGDQLRKEGIILNHEILNRFLQQGWSAIRDLLIAKAREGMKKMKVAGTLISRSMEEEAARIAHGYDKYHLGIQEAILKAHISSEEVTLQKNGTPALTEEDMQNIRAQFTYYLAEKDQELYSKLEEFCKHHNQLCQYLAGKDLGLQIHLVAALTENDHVMSEPGIYEIRSDILFLSQGSMQVEGDNQAEKLIVNPKYFAR